LEFFFFNPLGITEHATNIAHDWKLGNHTNATLYMYSPIKSQKGEGHSKVSKAQWWGQGYGVLTHKGKHMTPQLIS
jgi:hypothetical protein